MTSAQTVVPDFDAEMATTRRLLERVPSDQGTWKPHEKSFSLGHLAQLVARMPGWFTFTLKKPEIDIGAFSEYSVETTETLLAEFDRNVREARAALDAASESDWSAPWSLLVNGHVVFTQPRAAVIRQHLSHLVHHRGQLSVYLRLVNVPLPSIYGPTADERGM